MVRNKTLSFCWSREPKTCSNACSFPSFGWVEGYLNYPRNVLDSLLKICLPSAFQASSVRSVYNKINNYSGIVFAIWNNAMPRIQLTFYVKKKQQPADIYKRNEIFERQFLWWKDLKLKLFKILIFPKFSVCLFIFFLYYFILRSASYLK